MGEVTCLYCGKRIPDDVARCPVCGARSHYQKAGYRPGARLRFVLFFISLTLLCGALILWLPR